MGKNVWKYFNVQGEEQCKSCPHQGAAPGRAVLSDAVIELLLPFTVILVNPQPLPLALPDCRGIKTLTLEIREAGNIFFPVIFL